MSYQELDIRSTQLAHHLQEKGVNPGDLVGICMDRGGEMIISLLAILKAGAVYVPIDPEYPQDRKQFMIQDAQMSHLLCSNPGFSRLFEEKGLQVIMVDLADELFEKENKLPLAVKVTAQAPAYLMYTSGSLGQPKGVMIKHQSIARLLFNEEFSFLSPQTTLYQYAPLAFDASTFEIWGALLKGGKLVIANPGQKSLEDLRTDFENYQINTVWLTAGLFHLAADTLPALFAPIRYLLAGGDSIHLSSVERVMNQHKELTFINGYGPTESTTFAVIRQITDIDTIDKGLNIIGQPIGNTKAYVLAPESDQLLPVGCPGELCLSGPGLAEGYLNQPELSAQKFVANPYGEGAFAQLYRTGDLVRWLEDGSIEFLGRIDNQVKIRGYRIELGEIETILNDSALVRQGLVLAKDSTMGKRLVAYIIPEKGYEKESLLTYLKSKLPEYMMPALFIEMNDFSLTGNGKLDRKALPEPDLSELVTTEYIAPRNEDETFLVETWKNLLNIEKIGIHDNFFELGGNSLLATRLVAEIQDAFNLRIPLKVVFEFSTIAEMGQYIQLIKESSAEEDMHDEEVFEL
ncbi:MAG: hypothetical protein DHS20C18_00010 [Saprospiraceae bacterium]|nr:MAG: hypothetical protein DHS20C18_00010 [Saprospiraceae bacterium]